jgi:hypothetical protein
MILYPTTLLFRVVRALEDLRAGKPTPKKEGVSLAEFEQFRTVFTLPDA